MVDTRDLKSLGRLRPCRFESGLRHKLTDTNLLYVGDVFWIDNSFTLRS